MPSLVTDKGKVASPSFYGSTPTTSTVKDNSSMLLIYAILVVIGVSIVFILRKRSSSNVHTGPVLTVTASNDSDASAYANLTQSVNALIPLAGGASTPLTPSPSSGA